MIDTSKLDRRYQVEFRGESANHISYHATKEKALKSAYDRLDLAQRDAIAMQEPVKSDDYARERGVMASSWSNITKLRNVRVLFNGQFVTIRMEIKGRHY